MEGSCLYGLVMMNGAGVSPVVLSALFLFCVCSGRA